MAHHLQEIQQQIYCLLPVVVAATRSVYLLEGDMLSERVHNQLKPVCLEHFPCGPVVQWTII